MTVGERSLRQWQASAPAVTGDIAADRDRYARYWREGDLLRRGLAAPPPSDSERRAIDDAASDARERFLDRHLQAVYDQLTEGRRRFVRVSELVYAAADAFPGLVPARAAVAAEADRPLGAKSSIEIDQGILIARIMADETAGRHLCHAMLRPRPEATEALARFAADGRLDLGAARLSRRGGAVEVEMGNPRHLNAEDQTTIDAVETAIDVATLDPRSTIAILRGQPVDHPKYRGRRPLGSGINLTHLYQGRIPYLWYVERELGWVHKLLRGVARDDRVPDDVRGEGIEKPWIGVVECFAIGGHAQILLALDHVIATRDAYLTLPAQKEGIVPGAANMRLSRFVGERLARAMIQHERRLDCDSAEGRAICSETVPPDQVEPAIDRAVERLQSSGTVSALANRRAFRVAAEPLDRFRAYMAVYAREQARCHLSQALIANLERNWGARNRKS